MSLTNSNARLTSTQLRNNLDSVLNKHDYIYDARNARTKQTRTDASYVDYTYDNLGQLQSGKGYTSGGTPISTEQLGYSYDAAWNLITRTNNGTLQNFAVNNKDELTSEPNGSCIYDSNGNITSDGQSRSFTYDAENQLITVQWGTYYKTDFLYDGLFRRRKKIEYNWNGSSWIVSTETRYIYDPNLVIQERDSSNNAAVTYTRGLDLSAGLQGAGGIGGLLARSTSSANYFYHADGQGNITA